MSSQETLRDKWGNLAVTISVKGIVFEHNKIWLRKNERGDWELPGGRLEENEQPENTLEREILEELGRKLKNIKLVDAYVWKKDFGSTSHIAIVTFACEVSAVAGDFELIGEAGKAEFKGFTIKQALNLDNLAEVYKRVIGKI